LQESTVGWALRYTDLDDILAAFDLAQMGVRTAVATREITAGSTKFPRGTFFVLKGRNDDDVREKLDAVKSERRVRFEGLQSNYPLQGIDGPGGSGVNRIKKPEIGIVFGNGDATTSFGWLWYLMEREFKLPFTPLNGFRSLDKYTCIVAPSGRHSLTPALRQWVQQGGCLIVLESAEWLTGKDGLLDLEGKSADHPIPGALFRANMDPRYFLSYGYLGNTVAVPIDGGSFLATRKQGGGAITLAKDDTKKLLSGWTWPDETEKAVSGTVWLHDQPVGNGHVIVFSGDPTARAMWPGLYKLLLNAMLFGAS
jgi:hypothetical protein